MSSVWQRYFLVFWLALLQGFSPLLHAHMPGQVAQRGVHLHLQETQGTAAESCWQNLSPHDGAEIGVARAGRPDSQSLWPPVPSAAALPPASLTLFLPAVYRAGLWATPPPAGAVRLPPPSQAPPARSV